MFAKARSRRNPPPGTVIPVSDRVEAAGGVVMRDGQVALVHRPRYDDSTLQKGKISARREFVEAALRRVEK